MRLLRNAWHCLTVFVTGFLLAVLVYGCSGGGGFEKAAGPVNQEVAGPGSVVYVVNESTLCPDSDLAQWVAWQQQQIDGEFGHAWDVSVTLTIADPPAEDVLQVRIIDDHENGYQGFRSPPNVSYVNMAQSLSRGTPSVTFSHEVLEMLIDPSGGGIQVCDPVAPYGYKVGTKQPSPAQVADFTLPSYWTGGPPPLDWLGQLDP